VKQGETYKVSTRHQFEGKYIEPMQDEKENVIGYVFDTGVRGKGGAPVLRKVPARSFMGATKVK
jgi:hypothetical protein